jgi:hypothetical protein
LTSALVKKRNLLSPLAIPVVQYVAIPTEISLLKKMLQIYERGLIGPWLHKEKNKLRD